MNNVVTALAPSLTAHQSRIVWDSSQCLCVHTVKHEYPGDQLADRDQISSGASLGGGLTA